MAPYAICSTVSTYLNIFVWYVIEFALWLYGVIHYYVMSVIQPSSSVTGAWFTTPLPHTAQDPMHAGGTLHALWCGNVGQWTCADCWVRQESPRWHVSLRGKDATILVPLCMLTLGVNCGGWSDNCYSHSLVTTNWEYWLQMLNIYIRLSNQLWRHTHSTLSRIGGFSDFRLHLFPLREIFYFPWHRHKIEGTSDL